MRRVFAIIIFILIAGGLFYLTTQKHTKVNLLSSQDWSHFAGAETTAQGVHIKPVGRVLTHKDTSTAQLNPSVNVRGSHFQVIFRSKWQYRV